MIIFKFDGHKASAPKHLWTLPDELYFATSREVIDDVLDEAKDRFDSSIEDIRGIKDKAYMLLSIFIGILGVVIAIYTDHELLSSINNRRLFKAIFFFDLVVVAYSIIQLTLIINPAYMMVKGQDPKENTKGFDAMLGIDTTEQVDSYRKDSLQMMQYKIEFNESVITEMNSRLENVITTASFVFVVTLLVMLFKF